jgi:hypothetical protein
MPPRSRRAGVLVLAVALSGCVITKTARLYDLDSAAVLHATFKYRGTGKGPISVTTPEGAVCEGEYVTVAGGSIGWGTVFGTVYGAKSTTTTTGTVMTADVEGKQKGAAVASCTDGVVFECEYVTSAWSAAGYGACRDNRSRRYRLMF